jgi:hypothetical protein
LITESDIVTKYKDSIINIEDYLNLVH